MSTCMCAVVMQRGGQPTTRSDILNHDMKWQSDVMEWHSDDMEWHSDDIVWHFDDMKWHSDHDRVCRDILTWDGAE